MLSKVLQRFVSQNLKFIRQIIFLQETKSLPWWLAEAFDFSDGASLISYNLPPTQTVQAGVDHFSKSKLQEGNLENLTWQFSLNNLTLSRLVLLFDRTPFAEATPSGKVVQFGFQTQTLITLMISNATNGTFICQVNAVTVEGIISFPHQFEINVQVDVVGKLKVKSRNIYIYSYHICGKLEVAFKASPSFQHQHCTDEAQKAETVLYAVRYSSLV